MRNISFAFTTEQIRNRTKFVTRRLGWLFLIGQHGVLLCACEKCQGLKKGEKINRLDRIRTKSTRRERLDRMTFDLSYGYRETVLEGFPEGHEKHDPRRFVEFFCDTNRILPSTEITRIAFKYERKPRLFVRPCFGRSPKTGKPVGSRHRWNGGVQCEYCHRFRDSVLAEAASV